MLIFMDQEIPLTFTEYLKKKVIPKEMSSRF